ncbi:hypothetical protein BZA77DRAFT_263802 [Pyronema omphalodes]|nr:hypothetical protein BZA77DRAFT_263802 [Pyronema omphalodes]
MKQANTIPKHKNVTESSVTKTSALVVPKFTATTSSKKYEGTEFLFGKAGNAAFDSNWPSVPVSEKENVAKSSVTKTSALVVPKFTATTSSKKYEGTEFLFGQAGNAAFDFNWRPVPASEKKKEKLKHGSKKLEQSSEKVSISSPSTSPSLTPSTPPSSAPSSPPPSPPTKASNSSKKAAESSLHDNTKPDVPKPENPQLQQLFTNASIETLEKGVQQGFKLLETLETSLEAGKDLADVSAFQQQIQNLRRQAELKKTVIGVVGNTGAGKSSVINALLDEEWLLPTNCMRACTAVVTEISYNFETNHPYRCLIEFLSESDWLTELKTCYRDLTNKNGEIKDINRDADASIAWSKLHAVYPQKTKEDLTRCSPEALLKEKTVCSVLGKTQVVTEDDSCRFYKALQKYVDSGEKQKLSQTKNMQLWPLIRVVRIFTKSEVLKTGACIVDLPGVHDVNAARAAVAEGYIQNCTGLWVVAPITRAVDEKSAHKLMGEGFRRQLLMDGGFSSISFICSKADDISVSEATLSLNLDDDFRPQMEEIEGWEAEIGEKKKKLNCFEEKRTDVQKRLEQLDDNLVYWEDVQDAVREGKTVDVSKIKKKADIDKDAFLVDSDEEEESEEDDEDDEDDDDHEDENDEDDEEEEEQNEDEESEYEDQLRILKICEEKIDKIRLQKKELRKTKSEFIARINSLKAEIGELKESKKKLKDEIAVRCIDKRNKYSTSAIQADFAAGLRELDLEAAEERGGDNFNPDIEIRDYDKVANSLPVFCVSSRGYQKLKGRLKKDGDPPVFSHIDQTGIPRLQSHCKKLTEKVRLATGRRFLAGVSQLCNSLKLWSSGLNVKLTAPVKEREMLCLNQKLTDLNQELSKVVQSTTQSLRKELNEEVFALYDAAIKSASTAAPKTAREWNRYHWSTYRAICARDGGPFFNATGIHDFNESLAAPLVRHIATSWEKTFSQRIPAIFTSHVKSARELIQEFHNSVTTQAGPALADKLQLLAGQLTNHGDLLSSTASEILENINDTQKEANREFVPGVRKEMLPAYRLCGFEFGAGCHMRMKEHINGHVSTNKVSMFKTTVKPTRDRLLEMVDASEIAMKESTTQLFEEIKRNYMTIYGGARDLEGAGVRVRGIKMKVGEALKGFQTPFQDCFRVAATSGVAPLPELLSVHDDSRIPATPLVLTETMKAEDVAKTKPEMKEVELTAKKEKNQADITNETQEEEENRRE